jgi:ribosomal protein S18 acetylase RimI-like enzyme
LPQNSPVIEIVSARSADEIGSARVLFREYSELVAEALCFQGFEQELAGLPGEYAAPGGALLLARGPSGDAGCVALRRLDDRRGEMKRLYVRSQFRGTGLGRRLTESIVASARQTGYRSLLLDTLPKLTTAIAMYRSMGFRDCGPYLADPTPGALCFELSLS